MFFKKNRYLEILSQYDKAIVLNPNFWKFYFSKGGILGRLGQYSEALEVYKIGLKKNPKIALLWLGVAQAEMKLKHYSLAFDAAKKTLALDSSMNHAHAIIDYCRRFLYLDDNIERCYRLPFDRHAFVSYRAVSSVTLARAITEHFIRNGLPVWFDEYQILGDQVKDFEPEIEKGLNKSSKALIIRSSDYHNSKYCKEEFSHIKSKFDPSHVIEISLLPLLESEPKTSWPMKDFDSTAYLDIINFIDETWHVQEHDLWFTYPPIPENRPKWIHIPYADVKFNFADWREIEVLSTPDTETNNFHQRSFTRSVGSIVLKMHVLVNPSTGLNNRFKQGENVDDKNVFYQNLVSTKEFMANMKEFGCSHKLLGNHLIFSCNFNHFAFTYAFSNPSAGIRSIVLRKYVLTFPGHRTQGDIEVVITCGINNMPEYNLQEFVAFTPLFDSVVLNARTSGRT